MILGWSSSLRSQVATASATTAGNALGGLARPIAKVAIAAGLTAILATSVLAPRALADVPAGYTEYFVPGDEDQLWAIYRNNDNSPRLIRNDGTRAVVSVTSFADDVDVYYDHWEDGYDSDVTNPVSTTKHVELDQGEYVVFESEEIPLPRGTGYGPDKNCDDGVGGNGPDFCYDGRDRIYATGGVVTVTRASWPESIGTVYALAWQLIPVEALDTDYTIPVGEDLAGSPTFYDDFDNVYVVVQATEDNTTVVIDDPGKTGQEVNETLDAGETTELYHFDAETTVTASSGKPVQVQLMVGQYHYGTASEMRGFTEIPDGLWSDAYYSPVSNLSSSVDTDIYVYNPSSGTITVHYEEGGSSGSSGTFTVASGNTKSYISGAGHKIPIDSGVYLYARDSDGDPVDVFMIGSGDTEGYNYDWGFVLVPAGLLEDEYYVGWAPGSSDLSQSSVNQSPLWVTPLKNNTTITIDWDADGTVDETITGVDRLDSERLEDACSGSPPPSGNCDQSGAIVETTSCTDGPPCPLAIAYGEETGTAGNPGLDVGYVILPVRAMAAAIGDTIWYDWDGDGEQDPDEPGIAGVEVELTPPAGVDAGNGPGVAVVRTTDSDGYYLFNNLPPGTYTIEVDPDGDTLPTGVSQTGDPNETGTCSDCDGTSTATLSGDGTSDLDQDFGYQPRNDLAVVTTCADFSKSNPTYTNTVTNNGPADASGVQIVDELDPFIDYDGFTSSIAGATCSASGSLAVGKDVTCELNSTLDSGSTWTIAIKVIDKTSGKTSVSHTVTVSANGYDPVSSNNSDSCVTLTPVTLSYVHAMRDGDTVRFEWSTSTEAGNVGFNIYQQIGGGWSRINDELIPSHSFTSLDRQDYAFEASDVTGDIFRIEDVDLYAEGAAHGPFEIGQAYGLRADVDTIDWSSIRHEVKLKAAERARQRVAEARAVVDMSASGVERSQAPTSRLPDLSTGMAAVEAKGQRAASSRTDPGAPKPLPVVELRVSRDGIYRASYEQLLGEGIDLGGAPAPDIALMNGGRPVALTVGGGPVFGPGSYVEFVGYALDTLYTRTNVYYLLVDPALARRVRVDNALPAPGAVPEVAYSETAMLDRDDLYSFASRSDDPWFDEQLLVFSTPKTWTFTLDSPDFLPDVGPATLRIDMWGVTDWPASPDHHVVARLNGQQVADEWFDGLRLHPVEVQVADRVLKPSGNTLELEMPADTGMRWDMVAFDGFSVTYPRAFVAQEGYLTFDSSGELFEVRDLPTPDVTVYRVEGVSPTRVGNVQIYGADGNFTAVFPGSGRPATYIVSTDVAISTPQILVAPPAADIKSRPAQLLIVTHPDFVGDLRPLVREREAEGYSVEVVPTDQIYRQFGFGVFGPEPIRDYIAYAAAHKNTQYVLLVGGDTYDYFDNLGLGSVSFVPSPYFQTDEIVSYAPVDPLYTDLDGDLVPDLPIGRIPARSSDELRMLIGKILAYGRKSYGASAVFAADDFDGRESYAAQSDSFITQLAPEWSISRAYVDQGVQSARQTLIGAMNRGVALTSFVGHSSLTRWTFDGLLYAGDAARLVNQGQPTVVTQWGCWNTYYVSPKSDTMAHQFLLSGDRGAAAVLGAATLTQSDSEEALGSRIVPLVTQPGMTLGQAIQQAKHEVARTLPDARDVLLGWTLLGDPTMVVEP
jgi:uncharacterized repeat protein (TIGR01451 family)